MSLFKNERKTTEEILKVLKKGSISKEEYQSTQEPFFCNDPRSESFDIEFNNNEIYKDIPLGLNRNIILIYKILGNPKKEIYLGRWTILSLEEALKQYKDYCEKGQKKIYNIGYKYLGMGHVQVVSCDLDSHLLFYRNDGGSNGYDRIANYEDIINNGSKNHKQFFFTEWFYNIEIQSNQ